MSPHVSPVLGLAGLLAAFAGMAAAYPGRRRAKRHRLLSSVGQDGLTGLPDRESFRVELERRVAAAARSGTRLAVVGVDLAHFETFDDTFGRGTGDRVLTALARRLRLFLPDKSCVAWLGGHSFTAVLPEGEPAALKRQATDLLRQLRTPFGHDPVAGLIAGPLALGLGLAVYPDDARDADTLAANADLAAHRAARLESLVPCLYAPALDDELRDNRALARDLGEAVEADRLELHYQPQVALASGTTVSYEALLRWRHERRGWVPPAQFVPVAECCGLMSVLGDWVLRRACRDAAAWTHRARVAVNLSAVQLADPDLPDRVRAVLQHSGLSAERLELELTETALMADRPRGLGVLHAIKALGVAVALDDFGAGYSTLETLRSFPFDRIKLDRSFISTLGDSPRDLAIFRAALALGRSLGIPVLAEGIETDAQLELLRREGCSEGQGYRLGRPAPVALPASGFSLAAPRAGSAPCRP